MGKMLHNEARELLVESYEKTHNAEEIAKIFGVNKYTVYHCLKQSPARFCASVNGIASAGLRLMDIACNLGNCYTCRQNRLKAFTLRFDRSEYFDRAHVRGLGFLVWDAVVFGAYITSICLSPFSLILCVILIILPER